MLHLRAKNCRPCELFFSADTIASQSYAAYSFDRLVTDWGRYVENKLNERDKENKPIHELADLLHLDEIGRPSGPHKSKRKKQAGRSEAEVAAAWQRQINDLKAEMGSALTIVQ